MHDTKGDVALTNDNREKKYFDDFVQYPKSKFFAFPQPQYVLSTFLDFGHFSASCSYEKGSYKKKNIPEFRQLSCTCTTLLPIERFTQSQVRNNRQRTGRPCWCTKQQKVISIQLLRGNQHK